MEGDMIKRMIFFGLLLNLFASSQRLVAQVIPLDSLIYAAVRHHPNTEKMGLEAQSMLTQKRTILSSWMPDMSVQAYSSYQSMVPEFPIRIPGIESPNIPKTRYQISLDINQQIYDGGITKERIAVLENDQDQAIQKQLADRFPVQQQVVDVWYQLRTIAIQAQVLGISYDDLGSKREVLIQREKQGLNTKADILRVELEQLKILQNIEGMGSDRLKLLSQLSELTGLELNEQSRFDASPSSSPQYTTHINRPELQLFKLQQERRARLHELQKAQRRPKIGGFAQAAYGKPGLDLFGDEFSPFWQAGIRASWQLWDKGNIKRDKEVYQLSYRQIELDKQVFDRSLKLALDHYWFDINKEEQAILKDDEILKIRDEIKQVTEAQFDSGIITSTDLIHEIRQLEQARLQLELRKMRIQQAYTMIRVIRGEL
jgi:outer membrane protein TolC